MTNAPEETRTATFFQNTYRLEYWSSPDQISEQSCNTLAKAHALIATSKVEQKLYIID